MAPFGLWPVLFITLPLWAAQIDAALNAEDGASEDGSSEAAASKERASNDGGATAPLSQRMRAGAALGWWFGFGYFLAGLFWIGEAFLVEAEVFAWLLPFAVTLLPAGLALFFAVATGLCALLWPADGRRILVLALSVGLTEWLRGHILTGFPWNTVGYALTASDVLMQAASLFGVYGLTVLTIMICTTPGVLLLDQMRARSSVSFDVVSARPLWIGASLMTVLPLIGLGAYGLLQLAKAPPPDVPSVRMRLVQPSVPQREKWQAQHQARIFQDHLALSRRNPEGVRDDLAGINLVIWPEAAMPFLPLRSPPALKAISALLPPTTHLIAGALRVEGSTRTSDRASGASAGGQRRVFNAALVFSGRSGRLTQIYDKTHLVPFGEYLPFQQTLEAIGLEQITRIRGGFATGPEPRPLIAIKGLPRLSPLICYEAIFPGKVVPGHARVGSQRPGALINLTNDGWFGVLTGPYQHFHQTRLRAVEEGLPMIRVSNNGVSAVIDAHGRIIHKLKLNERGVIDSRLPGPRPPTLYALWGDGAFFALVMLMATALILWSALGLWRKTG